MTLRFKFTIHTAVGSLSGEEDANDETQLRECMPEEVLSYSIDGVRDRPGIPPISSEELWLNLCSAVENIRYASTLTPEVVAQHQAEQMRALRGLCIRVTTPDRD
ncbi:hypothetical protein LMG22037_05952 [Paraburkholderia phenoliruptrix]|uniref:Uncharacterized protein n=1 Tax=Paraburkholderia phenoliruptrix TaxID=252970 RepID=A0A6J5CHA7_9BURK|nr:hypothetical protein [Paraburkholderia phenoliruptrix]CAB3735294.1 hypothetical protein LMG22037_05952 [Paraburkholderia phenoliruptrix]